MLQLLSFVLLEKESNPKGVPIKYSIEFLEWSKITIFDLKKLNEDPIKRTELNRNYTNHTKQKRYEEKNQKGQNSFSFSRSLHSSLCSILCCFSMLLRQAVKFKKKRNYT